MQSRPRAQSLLDDDDEPLALHTSAPLEPSRTAAPPSLSMDRSSSLYSGQLGLNPTLAGDFALEDSGDEGPGPASGEVTPVPSPVPIDAGPQMERSRTSEGEEGELYIPGLTLPTLFGLIPMTDTLSTLVDKYIPPQERPPRDLTGEAWKRDPLLSLDSLITNRSWRAVATFCRDAILAADPTLTSLILSHWVLRLHSLLRLHLIPLASLELSSLLSLLPPDLFHPAVPFELYVLRASLPALEGAKEESVERLAEVLRAAKAFLWRAGREGREEERKVWRERGERVGLVLSGVLVEMKAFPSASHLLSPPSPFSSSPSSNQQTHQSPSFLSALCKLHLSTGDLASFASSSALLASLPTANSTPTLSREVRKTHALGSVAKGHWVEAEKEWRALVEEDESDLQAVNNLAVVLLFSERLDDAITLLHSLLSRPLAPANEEPVLFNLATLKELRTDHAGREKVEMLKAVVGGVGGGEGLRAGCFKLAV